MRAAAGVVGAKAITCAENNIQSSLDCAQSRLHARELNEVMRMH